MTIACLTLPVTLVHVNLLQNKNRKCNWQFRLGDSSPYYYYYYYYCSPS
jgi:hypothetical protein